MSALGSWALEPGAASPRRLQAPLLTVLLATLFLTLVSTASAVKCPSVSSNTLVLGIDVVQDSSCATSGSADSDPVTGCISPSCRLCQSFSTERSQQYQLCPPPTDRALGAVDATANRCPLSVSLGDAAAGLNILTDASCASGGLGCILNNCRFCKVPEISVTSPYLACSELVKASAPIPAPEPKCQPQAAPTSGDLPDTPRTNHCSANLIDLAKLNAGVWAFVDDAGCRANPTACTLSVCKYCRYSDSSTSLGYMPCPREGSNEQWLLSAVDSPPR